MINAKGGIRVRGGLGEYVHTNAVQNDVSGKNLYLRSQAGSEVRFTVNDTSNKYIDARANNFISQDNVTVGKDRALQSSDGYLVLRTGGKGNGIVYLQSNSHVRATRVGSGGSYIPVRASAFTVSSTVETKQEIKLWKGSALDILMRSDIYEYRRKDDVKYGLGRVRHGFVIGEGFNTPKSIIDDGGEGADIYEMSSLTIKSIQELYVKLKSVDTIKDEVNWLKMENQYLKNCIRKIEGEL